MTEHLWATDGECRHCGANANELAAAIATFAIEDAETSASDAAWARYTAAEGRLLELAAQLGAKP